MAVLAKVSYSIYSIAHANDIGDQGREGEKTARDGNILRLYKKTIKIT